MGKFLGVLALTLCTTVAYANTAQLTNQPVSTSTLQQWDNWADQLGQQFEDWFWTATGYTDPDQGSISTTGSGPVSAPEFDPAAATAALTLLAGGLAALRGRRTKK